MGSVVFILLRRLRAPLILLIGTYAVGMLGLVLMPGVDAEGRPWRMSFFHAFYVLSYTATTIGFGELPYPFSDAQRMWLTFTIYLTVVAWLYAVGKIIALFQDASFQRVVAGSRFARRVRALREPFVIVCGYGETGSMLVEALEGRQVRGAVVEIDPDRVREVDLAEHVYDVPALCADARLPESLIAAGLRHPDCRGLAALTSDESANLAAAVSAKLLRPGLPVLARCESSKVGDNLASFGTDHIVNAFEIFARELALAVHSPSQYLLRDWLTGVAGAPLSEPPEPPRGRWIICGYGRFGRAVARGLEREGNVIRVIEPDQSNAERPDTVHGDGTEARTLEEAGVRDAVGLVAGTPDDVNNFSIAMTARALRPDLFIVMRKNRRYNDVLYEAFRPQLVMQPAHVIATECLALLTTPRVVRFLAAAERKGDAWANELIARIVGITDRIPAVWALPVTPLAGPAAWREAARDALLLEHLLRDPADREARLDAIPLLLDRGGRDVILPDPETRVQGGDTILFCGTPTARARQHFAAFNVNAMRHIVSGEIAHGTVWRWLTRGAA